jgi:protein-cysteine N-palmitoyltransferase HHAT
VVGQKGLLTLCPSAHEVVQDNSDAQYASFRDNVPYLAAVVALQPPLRRAYERFTLPKQSVPNGNATSVTQSQAAANARLQSRLAFDFIAALVYVVALNGTSIFKIILILLINFKIATALPRHSIPAATWIFNVAILFANELAHGYRFSSLGEALVPFFPAAGDWGKALDSYGGLNPRWEVLFNLTVLRMISFNLDYYWSLNQSRAGSPVEVSTDSFFHRLSAISNALFCH